jgi:hypothetical protein
MKNDLYKYIETHIGLKEFIIIIDEDEFILNFSSISKFKDFLKKHLKKSFISKNLNLHIDTLSIGDKNNAYFPHIRSPLLFIGQWSKLGLYYTIERLK